MNIFGFGEKKNNPSEINYFTAEEIQDISEISNSILSTLDLDNVLQTSINKVVKRYRFLGGLLFLVDGNELYAKTISGGRKASQFLQLIGKPISDLKISLDPTFNNYVVDSVISKEIKYSEDLHDFTRHVLGDEVTSIAQTLTRTKACISIPIINKGKSIGALFFSKSRKATFNSKLPILSLLSDQIGIAVLNAQLYSQVQTQVIDLENRNKQLNAINSFTNSIITSLDVNQVSQTALNSIPEILGYLGAVYNTIDLEHKEIRLHSYTDNSLSKKAFALLDKQPTDFFASLDDPDMQETVNFRAFHTGRPALGPNINDLTKKIVPKFVNDKIQQLLGVKTIAAVPVRSKNRVIGILDFVIQTKSPEEISQLELDTMSIISNQIGIALDNANLYRQTQEQLADLENRNRQLAVIYNFTNKIISILDVEEIAQEALNNIPNILGYTAAFYCHVDKINKKVKVNSYTNNESLAKIFKILPKTITDYELSYEESANENPVIKYLRAGNIYLTPHISSILQNAIPPILSAQLQNLLHIQTCAVAPVIRENDLVGFILYLIDNKTPENLSKLELDTMSVISNQIGIALENATLYNNSKKALEELKNAYDRDKDMIDILGHELRTPATVCKGNLELLTSYIKTHKLTEESSEYIQSKIQSAYSAILKETGLINELLSATKLDSGQLIIANEIVNLYDMAKSTYQNYKDTAHKQGLELVLVEPISPIPETLGDAVRLGEVLDNLVSNAVKYTRAGQITISLEYTSNEIITHVKDTGNGIAPQETQNLFKKFSRLKNYISESSKLVRPGGSGLGLYVSKGIVEAHGGRIWVESEGEGKGSIFSFSIPIRSFEQMSALNRNILEVDMFKRLGLTSAQTATL